MARHRALVRAPAVAEGSVPRRQPAAARLAAAGLVAVLLVALAVAGGAAAAQDASKDNTMVLEMEPFTVPVFSYGKLIGQVNVAIRLGLAKPDERRIVMNRMPRLKDAFMRNLYRDGASGRLKTGKLDLDRLKRRFQEEANGILGADLVEVLIDAAQMMRLR